jgi:AcrR family transcriptional regulator
VSRQYPAAIITDREHSPGLTAFEQTFRILNMRSESMMTVEDLSTRARILGAAVDRFAQLGYHGTTIRAVAAAAGVSAALVVHYFGSKERLRQECDQRVIRFVDGKRAADSTADVLADAARRFGPYLARMLSDPGESADALFDLLLSAARTTLEEGIETGTMRASADRDAQAAALVALAVAPFFLAHQLGRWSGQDAEAGISRIATPIADIYARGLMVLPAREGSR